MEELLCATIACLPSLQCPISYTINAPRSNAPHSAFNIQAAECIQVRAVAADVMNVMDRPMRLSPSPRTHRAHQGTASPAPPSPAVTAHQPQHKLCAATTENTHAPHRIACRTSAPKDTASWHSMAPHSAVGPVPCGVCISWA